MQIHQLADASLFAISFWLAYALRSNAEFIRLFDLNEVSAFDRYVWLFLVLVPAAPMVLEAQGFYSRPLLCSRMRTGWILFKACTLK